MDEQTQHPNIPVINWWSRALPSKPAQPASSHRQSPAAHRSHSARSPQHRNASQATTLRHRNSHAHNQQDALLRSPLTHPHRFLKVHQQIKHKDKQVKAKPEFLKRLEEFVRKELEFVTVEQHDPQGRNSLDSPGRHPSNYSGQHGNHQHQHPKPSAARLQVHREAFQMFIEEFENYKPFLSSVKKEYELVIEEYANQLHDLPTVQAKLVWLEQEHERELKQLEETYKKEYRELDARLEMVRASEEDVTMQLHKLEAEYDKLQEDFAKAQKGFQEMKNANLHLVAALKRHETEKMKSEIMSNNLAREETIVRTELEKLRKEHEVVVEELVKSKAFKGNQGPGTVQVLQEKVDTLTNDLQVLKTNYRLLADENQSMSHTFKEVAAMKGKIEEERTELERLKNNATPRPDWSEIFKEVELYNIDTKGKTSEDLVYILVDFATSLRAEMKRTRRHAIKSHAMQQNKPPEFAKTDTAVKISTGNDSDFENDDFELDDDDEEEGDEGSFIRDLFNRLSSAEQYADAYIECLGTGPEVPRYLQMNGKVKNMRLSKRDTERLVKDCWMQKEKTQDAGQLSDFFYHYLQRRYRSYGTLIEYGYNIVYAQEKYSYDNDCEVFLKVLRGELGECVQWEQMEAFHQLKERLLKFDIHSNQGQCTNHIPRTDFLRVLRETFPTKLETSFNVLQKALFFEAPGNMVNYVKLFEEDHEGNQGQFCEALRDQYLDEIVDYISELENAFTKATSAKYKDGKLSISEFRETLLKVDPKKPNKEVEVYLARGCNLSADEIAERLRRVNANDSKRFSVKQFMIRLRAGSCQRTAHRTEN